MSVAGISVVLPVYNPGTYLRPCLDSLVGQDIDPALVSIIAVDDGSTDGSVALLEEYAAEHPDFRVIRQANSGGPGSPRNVGIQASEREYVFFADADDYLGSEALRRMYEFANEHGSDVTIPKLVGVGRFMHKRAWEETQVDADLSLAFLTMSPQKLVRRSFIEHRRLRFPEGGVRFEDGIFLAQAYLTAPRVSLLGDYDYYFIRRREDLGNRGEQEFDPHSFCSSLSTAMGSMRTLCTDPELAEHLVLDLYRRKALKPFSPERFRVSDDDTRRNWVEAVQKLADAYIPVELEERLAYLFDLRSQLVRMGDIPALLRHSTDMVMGRVRGRLTDGRVLVDVDTIEGARTYDATATARVESRLEQVGRGVGKLVVRGRTRVVGMDVGELSPELVLKERVTGAERVIPTSPLGGDDGWTRFEAIVRGRALPPKPSTGGTEVWSPLTRVSLVGKKSEGRLSVPGGPRAKGKTDLPVDLPIRNSRYELHPYVTIRDNLAIRVEAATVSPGRRRLDSMRLVLRVARRRVRARRRS